MDQDQPLRAASTVNDELEVGFDENFESAWSRLERVGRGVLCVIVLAGLAGALGAGPLDHARIGKTANGAIDYQPIARWATATQVTLHLPPVPTARTILVTLSSQFVEPFGLGSVNPHPVAERSVQGNLELTIAVQGGGIDNLVRIGGKPTQIGPIPLSVDMPGHRLRFRMFVLP